MFYNKLFIDCTPETLLRHFSHSRATEKSQIRVILIWPYNSGIGGGDGIIEARHRERTCRKQRTPLFFFLLK